MQSLTAFALLALSLVASAQDKPVLVEAESFKDRGGWVLDTQFVQIMGSPYLMAHGMGTPVRDATTTVTFPSSGTYKVHVRTKDWVARWKAPGAPGKFQVLVDGQPLKPTFGTEGADWFWHDGGTVEITKPNVTLALQDLTGFQGRCDAIVFSKDPAFTPPADLKTLTLWRKQMLGLPDQPVEAGEFDLVVVGGGYAGMGAAISGARMGLKVALIQDRPVLGGNGSSEIRVWSQGYTTLGKYPTLGQIVEEFADDAKSSPGVEQEFGDAKKEAVIRAEPNIKLFLNTQALAVETKQGKIVAVIGTDMSTGAETRFAGKFFADTTGHGTIGALAGAEFDMADGSAPDKLHMGMSNMWRWDQAAQPTTFPETPWALPLTMRDFPYPNRGKAEWFWEAGFFRNPITDLEYIRDWNFRAIYGAFNAMKNGDGKAKHPNAKLEWVAYVGGNRESRLLRGDYVLTREDVINNVQHPDGTAPTTWSIDLHVPKEEFAKNFPEDPFISKAIFDARVDKKQGYPIPYRCFYSKNVPNLFMAGRNISVDRGALGTVRVMRTCGMMGEVVGKAASICVKESCNPRDVYQYHLPQLLELVQLPGRARRADVNAQIDPNAPLPEPSRNPAPPRQGRGGAAANAGGEAGPMGLDPKTLPGIVVDDAQAKLTGSWTRGHGLPGYVGTHYTYSGTSGEGGSTARFEFKVPEAGAYEVRLKYAAHENRAKDVPVTVVAADGEKTLQVNQQEEGKADKAFHSLGTFTFDPAKPAAVVVSNKASKSHVSIDAVQVLPATK
jgi:hypothetical protein